MIYTTTNHYPVEQHFDGGDSAMRAGMMMISGMPYFFDPSKYEVSWGMLCRCPDQSPRWTNPLNFTRDQLIPFMAGLNAIGRHDIARRVAIMHLLRGGFCQDFQKDDPGSWKYPWPHTYADGSTANFNFADPTFPNDWWVMIWAGRLWPLMILFPICFLFQLFAVLAISPTEVSEQNQTIAALTTYPRILKMIYLAHVKNWWDSTKDYWDLRNEHEYAQEISDLVNGW